jgi:hypothetical protein
VPDHGVERVHGAEGDESGHTGDGAPDQGADDGVGGVLGDGLDDGPRDPVGVQHLRIAAAQTRQQLPGGVEVTGRERAADRPRLPAEGGASDDGPGGCGGQGDGGGRRGAYGTARERGECGGTAHADGRVQGAPPAVVPPQGPLDGHGGPPEHGDRMPPAGIAEQQVAEKAGGGAVREDAIGSHGVSPRSGGVEPSYSAERATGSRAWRYVLTQGVHALVRRDRR